jgi:hypothetical protein
LSIERCGTAAPARIVLASDSGRGAVETILARSDRPLAPLRSVLPERTGGTLLAGPEPGPLPLLASQASRAETVESRAKLDGGHVEPRLTWSAGVDGSGHGQTELGPGCHKLRMLVLDARSKGASPRARVDLDAEMRDDGDGRLLARDRSDAPDAEVATCLGERTGVDVVFAGAPPDSPILVTHVSWPLPRHLPTLWGPEATARMAHALIARHVRDLPSAPVMLVQGGSGSTQVPLSIEPGGCYVGVVALAQGAARATALRVHLGMQDYLDDQGAETNGAALAFCAEEREAAVARVEVRGPPPLTWGLAIFHIEHDVWSRTP